MQESSSLTAYLTYTTTGHNFAMNYRNTLAKLQKANDTKGLEEFKQTLITAASKESSTAINNPSSASALLYNSENLTRAIELSTKRKVYIS